MKKILLAFSVAALTFGFTACHQKELDAQKVTIDSLQAIVDAKDSEINELFDMLNEIEDNLTAIGTRYSNLQALRSSSLEGGANRRTQIAEELKAIEDLMAENKRKMANLNAKVSSLGQQNADLQGYIARLEERSLAQEQQIAELMTELENNRVVIRGLNQSVTELTASNQEKDDYIAQQTAEANRAYFIVGTYNELKTAGVVSKSGGFIGIGRKQGTVADMNTDAFTQIDRTTVTTITVNKRKAQVISQHPADSYELVADDDDPQTTAYLRILNPTQFWKYTDYLVISTK